MRDANTRSTHKIFIMNLTAPSDDLNAQELELKRLESDILRAREATALAEAEAVSAATALALAQQKASIAELALAPSELERNATTLVETAAFSLKSVLFALQEGFVIAN